MRYNGSHWRRLTAAALKNTQFNGIAAVSRTSVWAVGEAAGGQLPGRVIRWNGKTWKRLPIPWKVTLRQIIPDGRGGFWMTATSGTPVSGFGQWIVHRSRFGTWTRTRFGAKSSLSGLALVPGSDRAPVVGHLAATTGSDAVVLSHPGAR